MAADRLSSGGGVTTRCALVPLKPKELTPAIRRPAIAGQALAAGISFAAMRYVGLQHIRECMTVAREVLQAEAADRAHGEPAIFVVAQDAVGIALQIRQWRENETVLQRCA